MACRLTLAVLLVVFVSGNINSALGDSGIVVLTDANFERFTTGNDATILVFAYKQNDDFSKQLMPHMEEAAELLAEDGHTGAIGKLDGPSNMVSSTKLDLSSFPKVKLYATGKLWSREFELQADAAQIVQFMKLHIENAKTKGQKKSGGISSLLRDGVVHSQIEDGEDDKTIDPNPTAAKKGKITSYITQMKEREEKAKMTVFPPGTKPETVYNGLLQVSKELHELAKEATSITGKTGNIAALRGGIKAYNTKVNLIEKRIAKVSDDFDQWVLLDRSVRRHKLWGDMQKEVGNFVDELTIVKTRNTGLKTMLASSSPKSHPRDAPDAPTAKHDDL